MTVSMVSYPKDHIMVAPDTTQLHSETDFLGSRVRPHGVIVLVKACIWPILLVLASFPALVLGFGLKYSDTFETVHVGPTSASSLAFLTSSILLTVIKVISVEDWSWHQLI
jgi:hypothetical protein